MTGKKAKAKVPTAAQRGQQITWRLDGCLKRERIAYLQVGGLLAQVRDEKLYAALGHADMASYAQQRLKLGRSSLYRYLDVYDWARESHPEWLRPHPKGFIPDFSDMVALEWIESELKRKDLTSQERANLESLQAKAMSGRLSQREAARARRQKNRGKASLDAFQSRLRRLRKAGADIAGMPEEALQALDTAITLIQRAKPVHIALLDVLKRGGLRSFSPRHIAAIA